MLLGTHNHAKNINAATGTERIRCKRGEQKVLKRLLLPQSIPTNTPKATANKKPETICRSEEVTASQKREVVMPTQKAFNVSSGMGIFKSSF